MRIEIERDGFPRLQMLLLVSITGAAGFFASFCLLKSGMLDMWMRYLAAFGIAYLVFLGLLWLWLRTKAEDYGDFPDFSDLVPSSGRGADTAPAFSGKGGSFDGGGASASYDDPAANCATEHDADLPIGDALGAAAEADEFAIPLSVLIFIGALVLSSFWVIYLAPALFAELLVDGVLAASLYRRLRGLETRHWLETAVRRTIWPFVLTAVIVGAAGWSMQRYAPEAHSIGAVIQHAKRSR